MLAGLFAGSRQINLHQRLQFKLSRILVSATKYFTMIAMVDGFILQDDMRDTPRDWHNGNMLKMAQGLQWLTVSAITKDK